VNHNVHSGDSFGPIRPLTDAADRCGFNVWHKKGSIRTPQGGYNLKSFRTEPLAQRGSNESVGARNENPVHRIIFP
jgi:hypothetical protein